MNKLRKSFRSSFRRKNEDIPPSSMKQWPLDRESVRSNTCSFPVKYLGCVEVFEGRGLHICEEAVKIMKNSRSRPVKGSLHVSSDGLRLVDASTNGLVVDQTIEKVSFCAPDRNFPEGFSYICRDGASKRWMCHGFMAVKDSGERLSHALGCAFAICLERKQRRDRQCSVTINFDSDENTFTRFGSFRQGSITERLQDPQTFKPAEPKPAAAEPISIAKEAASNPHAVARPRVSNLMYERATSLRGVGRIQLGGSSPFKRQASLRLSELPSMLERQENLIEIEDLKTDPNMRKTKISSIPPDLLGPTRETETLSPSFSSLALSPSSVESNIFPMSVSQASNMNHLTKTITTTSIPSSNQSFLKYEARLAVNLSNTTGSPTSKRGTVNSFSAPRPPSVNSFSALRPPSMNSSSTPGPSAVNFPNIPGPSVVNSSSTPGPSASNPWDNVPDQSHIRQCDAVPVKRDKNSMTGTNVFGKHENEVNGFNGKRSSCEDPFDTDWAETAGSYNSENDWSSNPSSHAGSVQTFKLQL